YDTAAPVDPSLVKCQLTISKAVGKYLNTRLKKELKCQAGVAAGKLPGPCPDAKTATALDSARVKLDAGIRKGCTEAQLAATSPPQLPFGEPCKSYQLLSFVRDDSTNNNSLPVLDRFRQGAQTSAVGRVTTAPSPSDNTTAVRLGWSGDSNAFYRPYTSLDPVRLLAPDAWLYIGDTIYGDDDAADGVVAMVQSEY